MNPKYQVFISSTKLDLIPERAKVLESVLRLGHIPIGMEYFNAADDTQWKLIERRIEESDYYVVIVAHRYGSIDEETGLSYTEKEYDYAKKLGIPTIAFVLDRSVSWPGGKDFREDDPKLNEGLNRFIDKIQKKMRNSWLNKDDLATNVTLSLNELMTGTPRTGWIRADQAASPETAKELTLLSKENRELREEVTRLQESPKYSSPMPEVALNVVVASKTDEWYEYKPKPRNIDNPLVMAALHSQMRDESPVQQVKYEGFWLDIALSNSGTLATSLDVNLKIEAAGVERVDMDAYNDRTSGMHYAVAFARARVGREQGWSDAQFEEGTTECGFNGWIKNLAPGETYMFPSLPLNSELPLDDLSKVKISISIFPQFGSHISKEFLLGDILKI